MWKFCRSALVVLLLWTQSGCASYVPAVLPKDTAEAEIFEERDLDIAEDNIDSPVERQREIKVGNDVRVKLHNGESVVGEVLRISGSELVIGKDGDFVMEECVVPISEIAALEIHSKSKAGPILGYTLVAFGVSFIAGILIYQSSDN